MESRFFQWLMAFGLKMNENRLSDIVWALCQVDRNFLQFFFDYCFDKKEGEVYVYIVEREVVQVGGRNDFVFFTNKGLFILESKINDNAINAQNYIEAVGKDTDRIRYILALTNNVYNGWEIPDDTTIYKKSSHRIFKFKFKKWGDFAKRLHERQLPDNYKPTMDWQILGAFIIQTIYQRDCDNDKTINSLNTFSFERTDERTDIRLDKRAKRAESQTLKIKFFEDKDKEVTNKWDDESNIGYYISTKDDEEAIWHGHIYTPVFSEDAIQVLAIKCYEFNKSFFNNPSLNRLPFKHLTPIGIINRNEGWYYFKINDDANIDKAVCELKELLNLNLS